MERRTSTAVEELQEQAHRAQSFPWFRIHKRKCVATSRRMSAFLLNSGPLISMSCQSTMLNISLHHAERINRESQNGTQNVHATMENRTADKVIAGQNGVRTHEGDVQQANAETLAVTSAVKQFMQLNSRCEHRHPRFS